jgi:hypothetical protein
MKGYIRKLREGQYDGIEEIGNKYLKILFKAIVDVDKQYYYTENPENATHEIIEQLERIFAYELYYHWSVIQNDFNKNNREEEKRIINGEIRKQLLDNNRYPDMVLHKGHDDIYHQEIVVEIKRKASIGNDNVAQDLIKLSQFMTKGYLSCGASPYNIGVLILTGGSEDEIKNQLMLISNKTILNPNIYCVFCDGDNSLRYITLRELEI